MGEKLEQFGRVGVLMGGYSSERDISLKSGEAIYLSLRESLADVVAIDIVCEDVQEISQIILDANIDIAFIALHGKLGEDGTIQEILEQLAIPYTGSGVQASKLAINKILTQGLLRAEGVSVPPFVHIRKDDVIDFDYLKRVIGGFSVVVKPANEGSSFGIGFAHNEREILMALAFAWQYGEQVIIEKAINGREITVGILEDKPLPIVEIVSHREFFDFTAKYQEGMTEYSVPGNLPEEVCDITQDMALNAHSILGCSGFSRVDFKLDEKLKPYVLEVNTIPGFTSTSLLPKAANYKGINFDQLCLTILGLANGKKKKESQHITSAH